MTRLGHLFPYVAAEKTRAATWKYRALRLLARLFGKKRVGIDVSTGTITTRITTYKFRGVHYVTSVKREVEKL